MNAFDEPAPVFALQTSADANNANPLLNLPPEGEPVAFAQVKANHVIPAVDVLLAQARQALDDLAQTDGSVAKYDDVLGRLDGLTLRLDRALNVVSHLESCATTPALREAFEAIQGPTSAFYASIVLHSGLWRVLKAYAQTEDARHLSAPKRRYLDKTLDEFRRNGADLPQEGKARLSEIDVELAQITLKISANVLDATNGFELILCGSNAVAGLPESAKQAARESAEGKQRGLGIADDPAEPTRYRFTLQAPSYLAIMSYLEDAAVREQVYRAFNSRATVEPFDNRTLLRRVLALRAEKAKLLGFAHFGDLVLGDRMAKNAAAARAFVASLRSKSQLAFVQENEDLNAFRRQIEGADAPAVQAWDVAFYSEKQRKALYDFDDEALRPYFSLPSVLQGMFDIASRLYGVSVKPLPEVSSWNPDVRVYEICEADGRHAATFYVDASPREDKRDGAWMHGIATGQISSDGPARHLEVLVANVTPGVGGKPPLLTHREVETMLHEFGHLLHHALSQVEVRAQAGTNVAWDFVELPSQIMENWAWEREALDLFAHHIEDGSKIPDPLFSRLKLARNYRAANAMMRQLGFAELDLALHCDFEPERDGDVVEYARGIFERHSAAALPADYAMIASFSHLFGSAVGYAAGYYSYKWAEVLDADAFSRFSATGIFSREVGEAFRRDILERGDSEDPGILFERFMGRPASADALLERSGLIAGPVG